MERQLGSDWVLRVPYIGNKANYFFAAAENGREITRRFRFRGSPPWRTLRPGGSIKISAASAFTSRRTTATTTPFSSTPRSDSGEGCRCWPITRSRNPKNEASRQTARCEVPWERTLPACSECLTPSTQDACAPKGTPRKSYLRGSVAEGPVVRHSTFAGDPS